MNTEMRELTDRELDVVTGAKGVTVTQETVIWTKVGTLAFGIKTCDGVPIPYSTWDPA